MEIAFFQYKIDEYNKNYASGHLETLEGEGAYQLAASLKSRKFRGLWDADSHLMIINQFPGGKKQYEKWYTSSKCRFYHKLYFLKIERN